MTIENRKETNILLDDIRTKLNDLPDKVLALNILDALSIVENQTKEKEQLIEKMSKNEADLLRQNSLLYARVTVANEEQKPNSSVDYSEMDNVQDLLKEF